MSLDKYITYVKGVLGLGGGGGEGSYKRKKTSNILQNKPLCKMVVFIVHQLYKYIQILNINKSYKRQENARKHIASTHTGLEERITTKHFTNTKNKNTDYTIETFKPKPSTPPPEALTKTQYRIYVRSAVPKIYRALTIKQALTAVQGYSREADLLEDLYITPESSPASSTTDVMDERDLDGKTNRYIMYKFMEHLKGTKIWTSLTRCELSFYFRYVTYQNYY